MQDFPFAGFCQLQFVCQPHFEFPYYFRVLLFEKSGLWVFNGYGKGGCLLDGRMLRGGGAEM